MHSSLAQQMMRLGLDRETTPPLAAWQELVDWIGRTYENMDRERQQVRLSLEASAAEMRALTAALSSERDKFAGMFRAAPNGMAITSLDSSIVEVNGALEDVLGIRREQLLGRQLWELIESDPSACREALEGLASGRITSVREHHRLICSRPEPLLAEVNATAVAGTDGKPAMLAIVIEDVTERNRLEVELRHSQKLESVGRLASGIAHEINTPIQFVGDNVNFLASSFESLLVLCRTYQSLCDKAASSALAPEDIEQRKRDEEVADLEYITANIPTSIASTIDGVGRVARIVQSMKAFAHPDGGDRTVGDINAAIRNTLIVATNELKYVATVETEFADLPAVPCYLSDLNQVFLNLLVNAAHAIADVVGGTGRRGVIKVRTFVESPNIVVAISDTGTGIPRNIQGRIFDPFFTTKGVGRGTGQGLALAHSVVVEQHGGTITFETEVGKGTTFFVRIPVNSPAPE
jgi:PAS domain S-box-containing protein